MHIDSSSKRRIAFILLFSALFISAFWLTQGRSQYSEADTIAKGVRTFEELSGRFETLAQEKGAPYAFEVLRRAQLPPNTDLHLLGHVVGDQLYLQQGIEGIALCTQDFRNACSHTIVIGVLGEYGDGAIEDIRSACKQAPGGSGAYTMCFHGLGHGVLAFDQYNFERTQDFCKKTGTNEYNNREYAECMGGAVMEIISGGGHDRETWSKARNTYLENGSPLSLCQQDFFDDQSRGICYDYITPYLLEAAGANLGYPGPSDFEKAFVFCDELPNGSQERDRCFGGFGKEFLVLAQDRDVRNIESMTSEQMRTVHAWCALANDEEGTRACIRSAVQSAYWGGENDPRAALLLCRTSGKEYQVGCFKDLIDEVSYYVNDAAYREQFCASLPSEIQEECRSSLL